MNAGRILIIEDDEDFSDQFRQMLEYHLYEVQCAKSWSEAREVLRSFRAVVAIVDLLLISSDGVDGFDVIRQLRASEHSHIGILAWTAQYLDSRHEILSLRVGADDYVRKGTEVGLIEARIEALARRVERYNSGSELYEETIFRKCTRVLIGGPGHRRTCLLLYRPYRLLHLLWTLWRIT